MDYRIYWHKSKIYFSLQIWIAKWKKLNKIWPIKSHLTYAWSKQYYGKNLRKGNSKEYGYFFWKMKDIFPALKKLIRQVFPGFHHSLTPEVRHRELKYIAWLNRYFKYEAGWKKQIMNILEFPECPWNKMNKAFRIFENHI